MKTPKDKDVIWISMELAPKDKVITVYDPKPSIEYGSDIHKAVWSLQHNKFIAIGDHCTDPFDINPECFTYDL